MSETRRTLEHEMAIALERLGADGELLATIGRDREKMYAALERLGASRELLATIRSWGDDDERVLAELRRHNAGG